MSNTKSEFDCFWNDIRLISWRIQHLMTFVCSFFFQKENFQMKIERERKKTKNSKDKISNFIVVLDFLLLRRRWRKTNNKKNVLDHYFAVKRFLRCGGTRWSRRKSSSFLSFWFKWQLKGKCAPPQIDLCLERKNLIKVIHWAGTRTSLPHFLDIVSVSWLKSRQMTLTEN